MARNFNGTTDHISTDGLLTTLANETVGTIAAWVKLASDNNDTNIVFSVSRDVDATLTEFFLALEMSGVFNNLRGFLREGGTVQWDYRSPGTSINPYIGTFVHVAVTQDGVEPNLFLAGSAVTLTKTTTTDTTKWFKAVITDAASPSDTSNIGMLEFNGTDIRLFNGDISELGIWNVVLDDAQIAGLAEGFSPLNYSNGLKTYYPIIGRHSPEIELINGDDGTVSGTTTVVHPRVFYGYSPSLIHVPAGVNEITLGSDRLSFYLDRRRLSLNLDRDRRTLIRDKKRRDLVGP